MRRSGLALGAVFLFAVAVPTWVRISRSWPLRVAVSGHSMEPGLEDGDWLLVDPVTSEPRRGELVVVRDPRRVERLLVKRVVSAGPDGSLLIAGDHPAHRQEGGNIGRVGPELIVGRPWLRYWPPTRIGPL